MTKRGALGGLIVMNSLVLTYMHTVTLLAQAQSVPPVSKATPHEEQAAFEVASIKPHRGGATKQAIFA
jgi:hypothetical protein